MFHSAPFAHSDYQVIELKASYIECDALEELSIGGGEKGAFRYVPELSLSSA